MKGKYCGELPERIRFVNRVFYEMRKGKEAKVRF